MLNGQLLAWFDAEPADGVLLDRFTCTTPKPSGRSWRQPHPRPWELAVQAGFRVLRPPLGPGYTLLLGKEPDGEIGAAVGALRLGLGEYRLCSLAVSVRHRGQGGGHAREAWTNCLQVLEGEAVEQGAEELFVRTQIHLRNFASQTLAKSLGFEETQHVQNDLVTWTFLVDIGS